MARTATAPTTATKAVAIAIPAKAGRKPAVKAIKTKAKASLKAAPKAARKSASKGL